MVGLGWLRRHNVSIRLLTVSIRSNFAAAEMATPTPAPAAPVPVPVLDHLEEDDEFEEFEAQGLCAVLRSFGEIGRTVFVGVQIGRTLRLRPMTRRSGLVIGMMRT
jgi:hypothetical protein